MRRLIRAGEETNVLEDDLLDFDTDPVVTDQEAEDWDEETLGLDWNEADAQSVLSEVIPTRGFGD